MPDAARLLFEDQSQHVRTQRGKSGRRNGAIDGNGERGGGVEPQIHSGEEVRDVHVKDGHDRMAHGRHRAEVDALGDIVAQHHERLGLRPGRHPPEMVGGGGFEPAAETCVFSPAQPGGVVVVPQDREVDILHADRGVGRSPSRREEGEGDLPVGRPEMDETPADRRAPAEGLPLRMITPVGGDIDDANRRRRHSRNIG